MGRLFGTDGVRGVANADLDVELAVALGRAGAMVLGQREGRAPRLLVGRDTRRSGELLACALAAGAMSVGADVVRLGVATTPAVAYLVRTLGLDAGVVISASHNPAPYNGIKFFDRSGYKLPDALEDQIESVLSTRRGQVLPTGSGIGIAHDGTGYLQRYVEFLVRIAGDLSGLSIVCDCANGAAYRLAPAVFASAGATVEVIACNPDGENINDQCGSLYPDALAQVVRQRKADIGLAFDGDADRLIAIDEHGDVVDGDHTMAILGCDLLAKGQLPGCTVVGTVMSNLGLQECLERVGGRLLRTAVGDRYVLEAMLAGGYTLGGEQSGHIILLQHHTTGDGLCTGALLCALLHRAGRPLSELASVMPSIPQMLRNVSVRSSDGWEHNPKIQAAIARAEEALAGRGRVLVRPSGTEPLLRVMVEGHDGQVVQSQVEAIVRAVQAELGA